MTPSKMDDFQGADNFAGTRYCQVYPRSYLIYYR